MDRRMWKRLAGACDGDEDCEGIFLTEQGRLAIQGDHLQVEAPYGEAIVEISPELFREAARALG